MKISANKNKVTIDETEIVTTGALNVCKVEASLSEEYESTNNFLVVITNEFNKLRTPIIDGVAYMPMLVNNGYVNIGVYGFSVEGEEVVLRYSPTPAQIFIDTGSYVEGVDDYEAEKATDFERYVEEIKNALDTKQPKLTAGENIIIENNVISATGGGATYTAGDNITIEGNVINADNMRYDDTELREEVSNKQDKLSTEQLQNIADVPIKADKSELLNVVKTVKVNGKSYSAVNNEVDLGEISNTSEWVDCFNAGSYTTTATLLDSIPEDWETNYKNYFKQVPEGYWTACSSVEDWEDGKIYEGLVQKMVFDNPIPIGSKVDIVIRDYEKTYNGFQSVYLLSGEKNVYVTGWDKIWGNGYYYHWANTNFDFLHPGILSSMNQETSGRPNISIVPTQKPGAVYLNDVSIIDRILFTPQQYVLSPGIEIKVRYKKI